MTTLRAPFDLSETSHPNTAPYDIETAHIVHAFAQRLMSTYLPSAWPELVDATLTRARDHALAAINAAMNGADLRDAMNINRTITQSQDRYTRVIAKENAIRPIH